MKRLIALGAVAVALAVAGVGIAGVAKDAPAAKGGAVTVHGRWTLVVRNKHGRVVKVRHFENSLQNSGAINLVNVLSRSQSVGRWAVEANASNADSSVKACGANGIQICWFTTEPDETGTYPGTTSKNLVLTATTSGTPTLTLSGSVTATVDGSINQVVAGFATCGASTLPAACKSTVAAIFTLKNITPVDVTKGQSISLTVNYTFS